ncbi:hypothetical protein R1sor_013800 [Riccia sorocarpa]|uniref:Protein NRDE2 homolog n=1 Tax=Riccia sorocarpa TaxID=122646 RepID=A0ABD3HBQ4_9MARC
MAAEDDETKTTGLIGTSAAGSAALFPVVASTPQAPSAAPRLFPSFLSASTSSQLPITNGGSQQRPAPEWLSNSSFSESLLPPPLPSAPSPVPASFPGADAVKEDLSKTGPAEQLQESVLSSDVSSSADEDAERKLAERKRRKKKKRRKREEEERKAEKRRKKESAEDADTRKIGALDSSAVERKSAVSVWADLNESLPKEYYFDSRGDRDNLAFGSLYRMDIARYKRQDVFMGPQGFCGQPYRRRKTFLDAEGDGIVQDEVMKNAGRYWAPKYSSLERKRKMRHLSVYKDRLRSKSHHHGIPSLEEFIPLEVEEAPKDASSETEKRDAGETWQEYVTRKTREYNEQTRERPHDESLWISFANFQDELIQATDKKAVVQQALEKKIAILEKALHLHADSEDLLLLYLETCQRRDTTGALVSKWEDAISRHPFSFRMWREFLRFRCSQFSTFSVSSVRALYIRGLQALSAGRNRLQTKGEMEDDNDARYVEAEQALVSMFVDLCRFNWQAGHHEQAVGLFQAGIEYSRFAPPIQLTESNKVRLFEAFWNSGAPRIGEDGALGWATWLEKEEEQVQRARELNLSSEVESEQESGGWTGWSEPEKESAADETLVDGEIADMGEDAEADADVTMEEQEEEDDAALLEKLGLSLDPGKEVEVNDTSIWKRWSEREAQRDREQWLPLRTKHANDTLEDMAGDDEGEELERIIHFEDIKECLFTLHSKQGLSSLVCQILDFCDGPLGEWCCSNSWSYRSPMESLEALKGSLLAVISNSTREDTSKKLTLVDLVGDSPWYEKSHGGASFLRNAFNLVRTVFPHDRLLLKGLLQAEDLASKETGVTADNMSASRALGKKLLKIHRQDLSMWGAYASIEAAAGNIATARKVFDTTLASLGALPKDVQQDAPVLYLAYAELELARSSCDNCAEQRALHILCSLGSGSGFSPQLYSDGIPATLLLKAQRGFREQMQRVRVNDRGNLSARGAAMITCAALCELLTTGWEAAASVFEEGLAMTLPGKRQESLECELLLLRYVKMLENLRPAAKPVRVRSIISRGLMDYPLNAKLTGAYIRSASQSGMSHKLRRFFDDASKRNPSTMLWLFALSCELWRPGAGPRIHSLFERALDCKETRQSVLIWRCYLAYELDVASNPDAARRVYFRAIHACPWSKSLWTDGFRKLGCVLSAKEQSEFVDIMREKELRIRTDVYEILLEDAENEDMT